MNPLLALITAVQAFLTDAAPEIRERCTDTTYQKLQGLLVQLEGLELEFVENMPPSDYKPRELFPGGPTIGEIVPRVMAMFEKTEAQADQREAIQAKQLEVLERLATLLFDTGAPAA